MKWLRANLANKLTALLTLLVLSAGIATWHELFAFQDLNKAHIEGDFQLGFYDLLSQRKEIYNTSMRTTSGIVMSTITSPDDNRFVFKGKFTQTMARHGKIYFNLSPIYYSTPQKGLMIDGLMDLLMHTRFWMMPLELSPGPLVIGQSGSIFPYSLKKLPEASQDKS